MAITSVKVIDGRVMYTTRSDQNGWENHGQMGIVYPFAARSSEIVYKQDGAPPKMFNDRAEFITYIKTRYGVKPTFGDADKQSI